jgi:hypothetical protein
MYSEWSRRAEGRTLEVSQRKAVFRKKCYHLELTYMGGKILDIAVRFRPFPTGSKSWGERDEWARLSNPHLHKCGPLSARREAPGDGPRPTGHAGCLHRSPYSVCSILAVGQAVEGSCGREDYGHPRRDRGTQDTKPGIHDVRISTFSWSARQISLFEKGGRLKPSADDAILSLTRLQSTSAPPALTTAVAWQHGFHQCLHCQCWERSLLYPHHQARLAAYFPPSGLRYFSRSRRRSSTCLCGGISRWFGRFCWCTIHHCGLLPPGRRCLLPIVFGAHLPLDRQTI